MRNLALSAVALVLLCAGVVIGRDATTKPAPAAVEQGISVYFSPDGGCTDAILAQLAAAKQSIDVQAYHLTSAPISKALNDAHKRGVMVRVILDDQAAGQKYSEATYLSNAGIDTRIDSKHTIAHNKVMILDRATVITGSFNFTKAAEERNAENLLIIEGKVKVTATYLANFEEHFGHAEKYAGVAPRPDSAGKTK